MFANLKREISDYGWWGVWVYVRWDLWDDVKPYGSDAFMVGLCLCFLSRISAQRGALVTAEAAMAAIVIGYFLAGPLNGERDAQANSRWRVNVTAEQDRMVLLLFITVAALIISLCLAPSSPEDADDPNPSPYSQGETGHQIGFAAPEITLEDSAARQANSDEMGEPLQHKFSTRLSVQPGLTRGG